MFLLPYHHEGAWGRWLDAMLDIRSRSRSNMLMLWMSAKSQTWAKSHSSEVVKPKAVLPVCFIHLYASAKCCSHRSTCSCHLHLPGCGRLAHMKMLHLLSLFSRNCFPGCITSNNCWTNSGFMLIEHKTLNFKCLIIEPAHSTNTFVWVSSTKRDTSPNIKHLLTLMSIQSSMTFYLLWYKRRYFKGAI